MVSSVKPFQLMMGKIVGIALVGFVQLAIWGIMLAIILTVAGTVFGISGADMAQTQQMGMAGMSAAANPAAMQTAMPSESQQLFAALINLPYAELGTCFVLYFIGGYLLYASFFAAIGASVNEQEDSSQFMMPVIIIMILVFMRQWVRQKTPTVHWLLVVYVPSHISHRDDGAHPI